MVSLVSGIFDTEDSYLSYSKKGGFVDLEEGIYPGKLKVITRGLEISVFVVVDYSLRSESGCMIVLGYQAYSVTGLPKDLCIIYMQCICI